MSQQQAKGANPDSAPTTGEDGVASRTSLGGFLVPVALVAGLGIAGLYFYRARLQTKEAMAGYLLEARDKVKKHDLAALKSAEEVLKKAIEIDEDPRALSMLALTYFHQSEHGLDTLGAAETYLKKAIDEGADTPYRYAVDGYLKIKRGNAAQADKELDDLMESERGGSETAHALGWAKAEQGQFVEGNRIIRMAQEGDFSAMAYNLTLAEIAERNGDDRAAIRHLQNVLRDSANPAHNLARAWLSALSAKSYGGDVKSVFSGINQVQEKLDAEGPRTKGYVTWAMGELSLALGQADQAITKADEAAGILPDYAPILDLKARALRAQGKLPEALAVYEKAMAMKPEYRGIAWEVARLKSEQKDDAALSIVEQLEKTVQGTKGPDYELFRGEHFLQQGKLEEAKAAFTRAAELGDDPMILLGLAKVSFEEEKAKAGKADLEKVGEAISQALERRASFPEAQELLAEVSYWNYLVDAAHDAWNQAEAGYKKARRPMPEMTRFYDRVISQLERAPGQIKGPASAKAAEWKKRKADFNQATVASATGG